MQKRWKLQSQSDRKRMALFFSYFFLLLLAVTLLLSFGQFFYTDAMMREDYQTNNENTFALLRHSHEVLFDQMEYAVRGLFDNAKYENFLSYYQNNKMLKAIEVLEDLNVIKASMNALECICLYYPEAQITLSTAQSVSPLSLYHDQAFIQQFPDMPQLFKRTFSRQIQYPFAANAINVITFVRTIPRFSGGRAPTAYAIIDIKSDALYSSFSEISLKENANFLVYDASNALIHATGERLSFNEVCPDEMDTAQKKAAQKTYIHGHTYHTSVIRSEDTGWTYVYLQDIQDIDQHLLRIRNAFLLFAFIILLLGVLYSLLASRKLNQPLQRISKRLRVSNEDTDVFARIDRLITQNERLDAELANNAIIGKNQQLLHQMLMGFASEKETSDCLQLNSGENECLLFLLGTHTDCMPLSDVIIASVLEAYALRLVIKIYSHKNEIALILAGASPEKEILLSAANELIERFPDGITAIGISQGFSDATQIAKAYHQASTALGMRLVRGCGSVCHYQDILNPPALNYPYRLENVIFHAIKVLNYPATVESMGQFQQYLIQNDARARIVKSFYMQLFSSTQQLMIESASPKTVLAGFNHCDLLEAADISEMSAYMLQIFELLIQSGAQADQDENDLVDRICCFLEAHLDNMPTQETLAEEFFISLKTLRLEFQRVKGMSIKNYTDHLKIEKSKEMLQSPQIKIQEIAQRMGFSYPQSFIAFFKSFTGLTPGEWRESFLHRAKS